MTSTKNTECCVQCHEEHQGYDKCNNGDCPCHSETTDELNPKYEVKKRLMNQILDNTALSSHMPIRSETDEQIVSIVADICHESFNHRDDDSHRCASFYSLRGGKQIPHGKNKLPCDCGVTYAKEQLRTALASHRKSVEREREIEIGNALRKLIHPNARETVVSSKLILDFADHLSPCTIKSLDE